MFIRSPLSTWINNPGALLPLGDRARHGDGLRDADADRDGLYYAVTERALKRALVGVRWAWAGFWLVLVGTVMAATTASAHRQASASSSSFYRPMIADPPAFYLGWPSWCGSS